MKKYMGLPDEQADTRHMQRGTGWNTISAGLAHPVLSLTDVWDSAQQPHLYVVDDEEYSVEQLLSRCFHAAAAAAAAPNNRPVRRQKSPSGAGIGACVMPDGR